MDDRSGGQWPALPPHRPRMPVGLRLLGGFDMVRSLEPILLPRAGQRLVAYLAVLDHSPTREHVAGVLWPEAPGERATASLRSALWRLRGLADGLVESVGSQLRLDSRLPVDLRSVAAMARTAIDRPSVVDRDGVELLVDAQDLLPDWDEEWLAPERERIRQLRLHALERVSEAMTEQGQFARAAEAALAAVAAEPFRESAQRALIRVFMAEGNGSEALRQFSRYKVTLAEELGVRPTPAIEELVRPLRD
jgi:DNA-binding SARP family transcriptional activator